MAKERHLIVLMHGIESPFGSRHDFDPLQKAISKLPFFLSENVESKCLVSHVNVGQTTDGIDKGGRRLADEIEQTAMAWNASISDRRPIYFSIVGHSLGGLYSRYCVGLLYFRGLFDDLLTPVSFLTIATPHLGTKRKSPNKAFRFIADHTSLVTHSMWPGSTVEQIFNEDAPSKTNLPPDSFSAKDSDSPESLPLMFRMTIPTSPFYKGLERFTYRTTVAAVRWDMLVPFCSAMISLTNPFAEKAYYSLDNKIACVDGFDPNLEEEIFSLGGKSQQHTLYPSWFPPHVRFQRNPGFQNRPTCLSSDFPEGRMVLDAAMVHNLQSLGWRRLSFALNTFTSHDAIIQKETVPLLTPAHIGRGAVNSVANILQRDHERASKQQPIHSPTPFPPPLSSLSIFSPLKEAKL